MLIQTNRKRTRKLEDGAKNQLVKRSVVKSKSKKTVKPKPKPKAKPKAKAKPKVAKKSPPVNAGRSIEERLADIALIRQWSGWFLIALGISFLIALFSSMVSVEGQNLLGPYLGVLTADCLKIFAGRFPVMFFVASIFLYGLSFLTWNLESKKIKLRYAIVSTLIFMELSTLFAMRVPPGTKMFSLIYENNGGALGVFLIKILIEPIFGSERIVPYIFISFCLFATIAIGVPGFMEYLKAFLKAVPRKIIDFQQGIQAWWLDGKTIKDTMEYEPGVPETPFKPRKNGPVPIDFDKLNSNSKNRGKNFESLETIQNEIVAKEFDGVNNFSSEETIILDKNKKVERAEPKIKEINNLNVSQMNTKELREYRDEMAKRQLIREMNQWEDKRGEIAIQGIAAKKPYKPNQNSKVAKQAGQTGQTVVQNKTQNKVPQRVSSPTLPKFANDVFTDDTPTSLLPTNNNQNTGNNLTKNFDSELNIQDANVAANTVNHLEDNNVNFVSPNGNFPQFQDTDQKPNLNPGIRKRSNSTARPLASKAPTVVYDDYVIPKLEEIFAPTPVQEIDFSTSQLKELSERLETQLLNFKVKGKVVGICSGPVITRFEVELAPGIKVSKISGLADDLALALKATSLRILAPIPGKAAVGIEVPNLKPHIVYCREILETEDFANPKDDDIKIVLGKDIAGEPYSMNLARAPHLLIAGQTGSGKSVCINALMASILCSKTPDELRMILVDPKVVELKIYENIPHLMHPVVTQPEVAVQALKWACWEMDRRYDVLAKARVRNLAGFNAKIRAKVLDGIVEPEDNKLMPFLLIVIDELADLMMVAGKEVEISIARIAQKARAVGIHLVLATQRPSTNVITGIIKANLPTRISFKVASQIDARTILDKAGAEKLLGRGDMLFRPIEKPVPDRVHGAFLTDEEAESLADACSNQNVDYPQLPNFEFGENDVSDLANVGPRDTLFNQAAELVVLAGSGSVSNLQRKLAIGHGRAGRIMDQLEATGIVGPSRGSKARKILMNEDELLSFISGNVDNIR